MTHAPIRIEFETVRRRAGTAFRLQLREAFKRNERAEDRVRMPRRGILTCRELMRTGACL